VTSAIATRCDRRLYETRRSDARPGFPGGIGKTDVNHKNMESFYLHPSKSGREAHFDPLSVNSCCRCSRDCSLGEIFNVSHKPAPVSEPILDCLKDRWSPVVFEPRPIDTKAVRTLFEAARWAASSFNEQPWRFVVVSRDELGFSAAVDCLLETNQTWAKDVSLLVFTVVSRQLARNGTPNRCAEHDLGLAVGNLCAQATALGLHVHQMGGVNLSKVRQTYQVPEGFDPVTAMAIGYAGRPQEADPGLAARDLAPRVRRPIDEMVFGSEGWGKVSSSLR
jgi:nitroreductase